MDRNETQATWKATKRIAEARRLITLVEADIQKLESVEHMDWCHAGDAGRLVDQLRDILGCEASNDQPL